MYDSVQFVLWFVSGIEQVVILKLRTIWTWLFLGLWVNIDLQFFLSSVQGQANHQEGGEEKVCCSAVCSPGKAGN